MKNSTKDLVSSFILLFIGVLALALSGCASSPSHEPTFQAVERIPDDAALIYFYRNPSLHIGDSSYKIMVDDNLITSIPFGGYYPYFAKSGKLKIWSEGFNLWAGGGTKDVMTIDVKPGKTYYVRGKYMEGSGLSHRLYLTLVVPDEAKPEIAKCKLVTE